MMSRKLTGSWTETVVDDGRFDTLTLDFTTWIEQERLVAWHVQLRTERCPAPVQRGPFGPGESASIDQRFSSDLLARGALQCVQTASDIVIETPQLCYGFPDQVMQTLLGTVVSLVAAEEPPSEPPVEPSPGEPPPGEPPPGEPPPSEPPLLPAPSSEPVPVPASSVDPAPARGGELFPYVYMSLWRPPAPDELALCFVRYPHPLDAPPSGELVQALARLRRSGGPDARSEMQRAAADYIRSDGFVRRVGSLPAPFSRHGEIHRVAAEAPGGDPVRVVAEIFAVLGMDFAAAVTWLDSPAYAQDLEQVWQSWFALVIELGDDARLRDALARVLMADHLLRYLTGLGDTPPTEAALAALAQATIILPAGIFPLPPAGASPGLSPPDDGARIVPYAIGDLQMVQQRLVGYALGDIARVESVMAGERRESVHRKKTSVTETVARETTEHTRRKSAARSHALTSELSRAIADVLQTTSYGDNGLSVTYGTGNPPGATFSGSWSVETRPGPNGPSQGEVMRSVRRVVEQAAERVARRVVETRTSSRVESTEHESTSVLDNTGGTAGRRGIWRWLDEIYEAVIVHYGNRLMFEFLIAEPAAGYVQNDADLPADAYPPVPPPALGIDSFEDITPRSFPLLAARYPSEALVLPPPPRRTVSGWARSGTPLALTIPDGYAARSAVLSYVLPPGAGTLEIRGVIGNASVELDVTATGSATLPLGGETGAVQVLLLTSGPLASPPLEPEPVQLSVEVTAEPSATAMDAWRLRTYQAIQAAYAAQLAAWQGQDVAGGAADSPAAQPRFGWRAIERRELTRGAFDLLFQTLHERTGDAETPSGSRGIDVAQPRQLQFFERTFEWRELSYRFIQGGHRRGRVAAGIGAVGDERFREFLEADWAQLLVPVSPREAMAALYVLASGMLWDGDAALIPAHEADMAVVSELKKLQPGPPELRRVGEPWAVVVPTTISVLQDGEGTVAELCAPFTPPKAER
jgi:hypothetical protein